MVQGWFPYGLVVVRGSSGLGWYASQFRLLLHAPRSGMLASPHAANTTNTAHSVVDDPPALRFGSAFGAPLLLRRPGVEDTTFVRLLHTQAFGVQAMLALLLQPRYEAGAHVVL